MGTCRAVLVAVLVLGLLLSSAFAETGLGLTEAYSPGPYQNDTGGTDTSANLSPQELDNLVAPIALYPDALVAQILGGATYPDQIVEADRFVKENSKLSANDLMQKVNDQPWDPSVKALTQFPSVLDNMSQNLSWTSALGEAAYYQQGDVMAAVQRLRKQAKAAGNLKTTPQQTVVQQDPQTIVIQPANPQVVYVPAYNPTVVYGTPYSPPGYSTGAMVATGLISFGVGMAVGAAINNSCCGWGWHGGGWGCNWHGSTVVYQRNVYVSRSNVYVNNNRYRYNGGNYNNGRPRPTPYNNNVNYGNNRNRNTNVSGNTVNINTGGNRNTNVNNRPNNVSTNNINNRPNNTNNRPGQNAANRPNNNANRPGYGQKPTTGTNTGAFSGYNKGGSVREESQRGRASSGAKPAATRQSKPANTRQGGGVKKH